MRPLPRALAPLRSIYVLGVLAAPLLIFLFVKSSQTGRAKYEAAEDLLARVEALDLEVNIATFPLLFELQTSLDDLTRVQSELYEAGSEYDALRAGDSTTALFRQIQEKTRLIDDMKAQQAVMRNSRAIATEMLDETLAVPAVAGTDAEVAVRDVEAAFLDFIGRRDPASAARLREVMAETEDRFPVLGELPQWRTLAAHADTGTRYAEKMAMLMFEMSMVPVPQQIAAEIDANESWFAARSRTASNYRIGLFGLALLLLVFSAYKAVQARRYYRMVERANDELEGRVAERTSELSNANEALEAEIRERAAVESQLRMAQKLEAIGQLAAGIAHEINTPTQYVSDNVSFVSSSWQDLAPVLADYERSLEGDGAEHERRRLLRHRCDIDYLREEIPAALTAANDGLRQISRIVRAIRDFSHPGDDTLHPENINGAIENMVTVAQNAWKYVAELSLDLDKSLPKVPCNVSAFNQVILNLVVNSAQAIESAGPRDGLGRIRISTRRVDGYAEIAVEDDGPGVPASIRHKIFDPFFTTKEVGKGTGQGLAIAFRVVTKQHGGRLTVGAASHGLGGARFTIHLPLDDADSAGSEENLTDTMRRLGRLAGDGSEEQSRQSG